MQTCMLLKQTDMMFLQKELKELNVEDQPNLKEGPDD